VENVKVRLLHKWDFANGGAGQMMIGLSME
jgi:hypothetical protein